VLDRDAFFNTAPHMRSQLLLRPRLPCEGDHRHLELAATRHRIQRGEDLLVGEIPGCAEDHQRVGSNVVHFGAGRS
jgi:hypothetical protein